MVYCHDKEQHEATVEEEFAEAILQYNLMRADRDKLRAELAAANGALSSIKRTVTINAKRFGIEPVGEITYLIVGMWRKHEQLRKELEAAKRWRTHSQNVEEERDKLRKVLEGINDYINSLWGERVQSTQMNRIHLAVGRALRGDDWQESPSEDALTTELAATRRRHDRTR